MAGGSVLGITPIAFGNSHVGASEVCMFCSNQTSRQHRAGALFIWQSSQKHLIRRFRNVI